MTGGKVSLSHSVSKDSYFEDYIPGSVFEYGEVAVSEAEIIEFARRFDPQAMHVDPAASARGRNPRRRPAWPTRFAP